MSWAALLYLGVVLFVAVRDLSTGRPAGTIRYRG